MVVRIECIPSRVPYVIPLSPENSETIIYPYQILLPALMYVRRSYFQAQHFCNLKTFRESTKRGDSPVVSSGGGYGNTYPFGIVSL